MDLNTVESQNFWPLVNDMEAELKALKNKNSHGRMMLKDKEEISDKELEEIMDAKMEMAKSQIDIKIKYHKKFKEVLPIKKVAKYYEASKEFKKIQNQRKTHHSNPGQRNR
jgi:oligoribonuclease NrnB/cAMP/cGMP phosphodiesterase (DHH superfamily)